MVGHHVAQSAGGVEISAAPLHAHSLGVGDLHVVDVAAIPDWLEDGIVEPEHHDVLYGFLAEIVIDPENLVFLQYAFDLAVQYLRRFQILSEGLLDHDTTPSSLLGRRKPGLSQLLHDQTKEFRSGC